MKISKHGRFEMQSKKKKMACNRKFQSNSNFKSWKVSVPAASSRPTLALGSTWNGSNTQSIFVLGLLNEPWFTCMAKDGTKPTLPHVMVSEAHLCLFLQILATPGDFGKSHCLPNMLTAALSTHKRAREEEYFHKNFQDEIMNGCQCLTVSST